MILRKLMCFAPAMVCCFLISSSLLEAQLGGRPTLFLGADTVAPGAKLTVTGRDFMDVRTFSDVGIGSVQPALDIRIFFVQGKTKQQIAKVDANQRHEISTIVTVPENAALGTAKIVAEITSSQTISVAFTVIAGK